jgi:hypothetical protein
MIIDLMPDQLKLDFALWTRRAVKVLINRWLVVEAAVNTVGDYLRSWGFSPQRPKKKACEQNPIAVQKCLEQEYPAIKEKAKLEIAINTGVLMLQKEEHLLKSICQNGFQSI